MLSGLKKMGTVEVTPAAGDQRQNRKGVLRNGKTMYGHKTKKDGERE